MCAERAVAYFKDQVRILSDTVVLAELSFLHVSLHHTKVRCCKIWSRNYGSRQLSLPTNSKSVSIDIAQVQYQTQPCIAPQYFFALNFVV
jgi:predicted nucleic-acid-binding Zn-ribbon protein